MARNKKTPPQGARKTTADYYRLNLKAVDDLVNADVSNSPKVSEAELRRYRSGAKLKLPGAVKALLIKVWFAGAVCFFFLWGLGTTLNHWLDQLVVLGLALGAVTDLLTNNIYRFIAKTPGENDRWMMFPGKGLYTLPLNLLYAFLLLFLVTTTYNALNAALLGLGLAQGGTPLGVEPILFGILTAAWDTLLIKIKRTARQMLADAKRDARAKGD